MSPDEQPPVQADDPAAACWALRGQPLAPKAAEEPPPAEPVGAFALRLKSSQKSKKGRELDAKCFDEEDWKAFEVADAKQWEDHLRNGAVQIVPPHQTQGIDKRKIMPIRPRFVRTNRSGTLDPKDLEAKSRLVIPGHFIHKMRKTLGLKVRIGAPVAPQCALHLLLAITSTMQWVLTKFDVEAAFLTGKDIDEEV